MYYKIPSEFLIPICVADDIISEMERSSDETDGCNTGNYMQNNYNEKQEYIREDIDKVEFKMNSVEQGAKYFETKKIWNELDEEYVNSQI